MIYLGWNLYISLTGLNYNSDNYERVHELPPNMYTKEYGAFVITTLILVAAFVFVAVLYF